MRILLSAIYPYAFLLLYLIIPFDNYIRVLPNILLAILVVAFPFTAKKEDFNKLKSLPVLLFLGLFAYLCLNSLISGRMDDFDYIKKVLIAVGLVVLYIPVPDKNPPVGHTGKIENAIIFSSLAAIAFSVYNFVLITDATGSFALGDSPQVIESLLIDRLYLGLLSIFSILISFRAIQKKYHPNNNYHLANIFINVAFILLIASKIAVVALFILVLVRQFYGKRKIWKGIIIIGSIVALVGLFFFLKNEDNRRQDTMAGRESRPAFIENSLTYELRAVIWRCAQKVMDDEGLTLTGIGFNRTKDRLVSCYENHISDPGKKNRFVAQRYNTHNQFLDFYISAGFMALLIFVVFIIVSFFSVRKQFFPSALLAIFILYCMFENMFHRQIGSYYAGYILIMLMAGASSQRIRA